MNKYKYIIKKAMIGSTFGAAVLLGMAGMAAAQTEQSNTQAINDSTEITSAAKAKLTDPEQIDKAKSAVTNGYMEGFKRGQKDGSHSSKYNASVRMPDPDGPTAIAGNKYKPFFEAGYTRGYEDGYNKTTKFGEVSETGGQKGFSVRASVMDSLVGGTE